MSPEGLPWIERSGFNAFAGAENARESFPSQLLDRMGLSEGGPPGFEDAADIAASVQAITERILLALAEWTIRRTRKEHVAVSGGVFLNCTAVGDIAVRLGLGKLLTSPAPKDCGTALGAALLAGGCISRELLPRKLAGPFLGTQISGDEKIWNELGALGLARRVVGSGAAEVVDDLLKDKLVAVCEGALEFGPRALGGRSILARANARGSAARLNEVKKRYFFQPCAGTFSEKEAALVFSVMQPQPFMSAALEAGQVARDRCPAVLHVNGKCRIQIESEESPTIVRSILKELDKRGSPAVVVNTSFNGRDEPLPRTAEDSLRAYCGIAVDALIVPGWRVELDSKGRSELLLYLGAERVGS
jgi:carbamoyltransferase